MESGLQKNEYCFLKSKADQESKSIPWYLLSVMILIRPGRFMLSWGIHANLFWIFLAAWLIGASGMINTVVNRVRRMPETLPFPIDSWLTVWAVVFGIGIFRGAIFAYGLGGLWTWLKLRICGIKGNEWNRSTRIYCLSVIFEHVASLLALLYFSAKYDTLRDFIAQPVSLINLVAALFMLTSPIIAFIAVLACYRLRVIWAAVLFLIIPMLWRLALLAMLGYGLLTNTGSVLLPDTQHPVASSSDIFTFNHPKDWVVLDATPLDEYTVAQVEIESQTAFSSVLIRVLPRDGIDPNEHDIALITEAGYQVVNKAVRPDAQLGVLKCYSEEYELKKDQRAYKMLHLVAGFDSDNGMLIRILTTPRYWNASMRAGMQIIDSLSIQSQDQQPTQISDPVTISRDWFTFQSPSNWTDVGESHAQFEAVGRSAYLKTNIRFTIYDRSGGNGGEDSPNKELNAFLHGWRHKDIIISHKPSNTWLGFSGVGAKGKLWEPLTGVHDFTVIFVPLIDGRVLGIKKFQAESSADLTDPGFELIESTFKLLVDPAPTEP